MSEIERFVIRISDFSLDSEQAALQDTFRTFLEKHCLSQRVRAAEPLGFDEQLWWDLQELRPIAMGVPVEAGGDGGGLVELVLMCEELGRRAAPVPIGDTVVAARVLAAAGSAEARAVLDRLLDGGLATVSLGAPDARGRLLTGAGAVAPLVIGRVGETMVVAEAPADGVVLPNLASAPMAWRTLADATVIASGSAVRPLHEKLHAEWRLLMAATLVGLGDTSLALAVEYARERYAFGVPIGTFQAVAHPLVDVAIGIESARRLVRKAAWFADHEPEALEARIEMAFVHAGEAAERAGYVAIHTQGGFGFTLESEAQLFYRRAKGWPLVAGDRRSELKRMASALYGPATTTAVGS